MAMRIKKSSPTVFTLLTDGSAVLLNLDSLVYFKLNRSAAILWQRIEGGDPPSLDDLVACAVDRFDVDAALAVQVIGTFVGRLQQFKLARVE
ncbi:MAG TPA: PqqD family protein [Blastocatellia bacterium]|nr:PqqD family protein [Blastocatellia bacterium]